MSRDRRSAGYAELAINAAGTVMTREQIIEQRVRKGQCQTCTNEPTQLFIVKKYRYNPLKKKLMPLTIEGKACEGVCLVCNPDMDPRRIEEEERRQKKKKKKKNRKSAAVESTDDAPPSVSVQCHLTDSAASVEASLCSGVGTESSASSCFLTESSVSSGVLTESSVSTASEPPAVPQSPGHESVTSRPRRPMADSLVRQSATRGFGDDSERDEGTDEDGGATEQQGGDDQEESLSLEPPPLERGWTSHPARENFRGKFLMVNDPGNVEGQTGATAVEGSISARCDVSAELRSSVRSEGSHTVDRASFHEEGGSAHVGVDCGNQESVNLMDFQTMVDEVLAFGADSTAIDIVSSTMSDNLRDASIQEFGIIKLWTLAREKEENKDAIIYSSALDAIVQGMKAHPALPNIQERGCGALWSLGVNEKNRPNIAHSGGCECMISSLRELVGSEKLVSMALGALKTISVDENVKEVVKKNGVCAAVAQAMAVHRSVASIQKDGCAYLSNLAVDVILNKVDPVSQEEIVAVIQAMEAHPSSPAVQQSACFTLKNFTFDPENIEAICRVPNVCDLVESAARRFRSQCSPEARIILERVREKKMLADSLEESAYTTLMQATVASGSDSESIRTIVGLMMDHPMSLKIQGGALQALWTLCRKSEPNKSRLSQAHVAGAIVGSMARHPASASVQENGCGVLKCIADAGTKSRLEIIQVGGCGAIVNAMRQHLSEESVQAAAFAALNVLSEEVDCRTALERQGSLRTITRAFNEHSNSQPVQREGCAALANLSAHDGGSNPAFDLDTVRVGAFPSR